MFRCWKGLFYAWSRWFMDVCGYERENYSTSMSMGTSGL